MKQLWALLVLAACAQEPDAPVLQGDVPGLLRNPTAPLASQVDVTAARLVGDWFVRQDAHADVYEVDTAVIEAGENGSLFLSFCQSFDCEVYSLIPIGSGRWMMRGVSLRTVLPEGELWVLWMDFDDRTFTIADPLGRHVWILDQQATGGADRIVAARDILKWYGYDLSKLETVQ